MERQCEKSELRKYAESACEWCGEENCITPKSCKRRWEIEMGVAEQPISPLPVVPQSEVHEFDPNCPFCNGTYADRKASPLPAAPHINAAAARENVAESVTISKALWEADRESFRLVCEERNALREAAQNLNESLEQIATNAHRALKHLQNGNHGWALDWLETADEALQALTKARS